MDGVELHIEPPIVYDGNDPDFVLNGGPVIAPGVKVSTKGTASFKEIQIGDLKTPLEALQLCLGEMKEKLGRPGKDVGDRATKAEVVKSSQDQEVSLVRFIGRFENSLRAFLYMQHAFNLRELKECSFYSPEMSDPDFIRIKKDDLPRSVHFEVVGSRGVLGEEERSQKMTQVTAFASGNPLFAPLLNASALLTKMYQDAGVKNAESLLINATDLDPMMLAAKLKEATMGLQKMGQALKDEKNKNAYKMAKIQADQSFKDLKLKTDHMNKQQKMQEDALKDRESARQFNEELKRQYSHDRKEFTAKMRAIEASLQKAGIEFHSAHLDREAARDAPDTEPKE